MCARTIFYRNSCRRATVVLFHSAPLKTTLKPAVVGFRPSPEWVNLVFVMTSYRALALYCLVPLLAPGVEERFCGSLELLFIDLLSKQVHASPLCTTVNLIHKLDQNKNS